MVWPLLGLNKRTSLRVAQHRRTLLSITSALQRQEVNLAFVKREERTEDQLNNLPAGEHDFFDRKSGALFNASDRNSLSDTLAKAASAFANSGGGHLVLGVADDGTLDGVPKVISGRAKTRDWLEQKIPDLLDYRLSDFRVHTVVPSVPTQIPPNRELIVIDFGDSGLAPHQSRRDHTYYYRSAGRSVPAPHFYLELLRQRLTNPVLDFKLSSLDFDAWELDASLVLRIEAKFAVENTGRVAAYKWALVRREFQGLSERINDYFLDGIPGASGRVTSVRIDDTILPGCTLFEAMVFGVLLRSVPRSEESIRSELETFLLPMTLTLQLATETSPGATKKITLEPHLQLACVLDLLRSKGMIEPPQAEQVFSKPSEAAGAASSGNPDQPSAAAAEAIPNPR